MVVVLAAQQFCGQSDLLIDCNLQLCCYSLPPCPHAAMPPCPRKCLAENMPCLVQFSAAAMSTKIPHRKHASSHPGSPYATKRGHALIATQPESFPLSVNSRRPTDHRAKSRSALMPRQTLGRSLVTGSKQSADPPVSPQSKQFPF
jgi:hypothetical protein